MVPVSWRSAFSMRSMRADSLLSTGPDGAGPGTAWAGGACSCCCGWPRLNKLSRKPPERSCATAAPAIASTRRAASAAMRLCCERVM